jgi:site-specific recombinase XerD
MKWEYWLSMFIHTHCVARGLRPLTIAAYDASIRQFITWSIVHLKAKPPDEVTTHDVLEYLEYLRRGRSNGASAVNRAAVVLRSFYRAIVAMGYLDAAANPLANLPKIKGAPRKLPVSLSSEEVERLLVGPGTGTIVGLRDRAILALLYGTGIRATECARLRVRHVSLDDLSIKVNGKGGHDRVVPLNERVASALRVYVAARGPVPVGAPFFVSRFGRALSRGAVYDRVRTWGRKVRLKQVLSPHRLRHTFATHLVRAGVGIVTIRDLLGHRQITSTQIYLHSTAQDLRAAADRHPIARLLNCVEHLLPKTRLPFQRSPPLPRPT